SEMLVVQRAPRRFGAFIPLSPLCARCLCGVVTPPGNLISMMLAAMWSGPAYDTRELLLHERRVELRDVSGRELVERGPRRDGAVVKDLVHLAVGRRGREVAGRDLAQQIEELLGHLHGRAQDVLAAAGDAHLEELLFDRDDLLVEGLGRVADILGSSVAGEQRA